MKIVCQKNNLVKGVSTVLKAVPSKTTMPILECILIDATNDIIKLTANDMELGIQTEIEGDIIERGMIAIDAKIFSEIVRKLPDNDVFIEVKSHLLTCFMHHSLVYVFHNICGILSPTTHNSLPLSVFTRELVDYHIY